MKSFLHIQGRPAINWITALVLSMLVLPSASGQNHDSDAEMFFEVDTIDVEKGSTFTNLLIFRNTSDEDITLKALTPNDRYPGLIFYPRNETVLGPDEERRLPIKFIANLEFLKMQSNVISFTVSWSTPSGTREQEVEFFLSKTEDRTIGLSPFSRENYIYPDQPETTIMLILHNRAYSSQSIKLEYRSVPEGLEFEPNQETVVVDGLERQVIPIRVRQRRQQSLYPEYRIEVMASEVGSQEEKGRISIPVVVLAHQRQVIAGTTVGGLDNFAEVAFNQYNTGQNYMYIRGNQEVPLSDNLVGRLNLTADIYQQQGLYQLYDTWVELEHKNSILRAGNVYGSDYDYAISGRGAKFGTGLGGGRDVEVMALENNYHLRGTYFPESEGARMIGAKYRFDRSDTWNGKMSYLFDNDPRRSINTHVANFQSSANFNDRHHVRLEAGLSHEKGLMTGDQKPGFSAAVDYETRSERWVLQSRNSYASGSYAGLSRGSYNTTQRVDRTFSNNTGLYFAYQNLSIQPEYLPFQHNPELTPTNYSYQTQAIKTGYRFPVRNWNITLSPQYHKQMQTLNGATADFQAYRFQTNVSTSMGSHGIYWNTDYSYSLADRNAGWFHGLSSNLMYRYQGLSLHGAVQWNPNSVIDLNSYYYNNESFVNYSAYASYNFNALRRALTGTISAGAYYSELYENLNRTVSGNLEYRISPTWSLTGNFNYSHYESLESEGYTGQNYQLRIGVKKYFPVSTAIENHKVSFVLYEDRNFNEMLDIGEATLSNELVKLEHYVAITDGDGRVTFLNVPPGNYNLQVNEPSSSRLTIDPQITVDQNLNMEVGMVRNIRIIGKMQEVRQPYDDLETNVAGIKVFAKGEDGAIATTVVNHDHVFEFFLADGTYEIYVENNQFEFHEPIQQITVDGSAPEKPIVFDYSKKDRKIEVKQF